MSFSVGIVGLPNVGKSTLFNALTKNQAETANYPFCTINPNVGVVEVPDERLQQLSDTCKSAKIIPTVIEFVDIAGLVKGASKGEGLGNQFLANIREVDAIAQVVRGFDNKDIKHVHDRINPQEDVEIINTELILADLASVEKRLSKATRDAKSGEYDLLLQVSGLTKLKQALEAGMPARYVMIPPESEQALVRFQDSPTDPLTTEEKDSLKDLPLITAKPQFYILNVDEAGFKNGGGKYFEELKKKIPDEIIVPFSAKIETELNELDDENREVFMKEYGFEKSGLEAVITAGYQTLNLLTFFTAGEKETRAWTGPQGALAPQAAGVIHTDFEKGFIKAEVVDWQELVRWGDYNACKEAGKLRLEGKEYVIKDGDVVHFKFNVT